MIQEEIMLMINEDHKDDPGTKIMCYQGVPCCSRLFSVILGCSRCALAFVHQSFRELVTTSNNEREE